MLVSIPVQRKWNDGKCVFWDDSGLLASESALLGWDNGYLDIQKLSNGFLQSCGYLCEEQF